MDLNELRANAKKYSNIVGFGCLFIYIGLLVYDGFLDGDDDFNFPAVKEIIAFIGAFFLGMFVSDMKNRSSETQE